MLAFIPRLHVHFKTLQKENCSALYVFNPTASAAVVAQTDTRTSVIPPRLRGEGQRGGGGLGRQRVSLPPLPPPLRGRKWPGLRSLLVWFLARCLLLVRDRLLAFIVLLNSYYVALSLFSVSPITSSSCSVTVSLRARAAHGGFSARRSRDCGTRPAGRPACGALARRPGTLSRSLSSRVTARVSHAPQGASPSLTRPRDRRSEQDADGRFCGRGRRWGAGRQHGRDPAWGGRRLPRGVASASSTLGRGGPALAVARRGHGEGPLALCSWHNQK